MNAMSFSVNQKELEWAASEAMRENDKSREDILKGKRALRPCDIIHRAIKTAMELSE